MKSGRVLSFLTVLAVLSGSLWVSAAPGTGKAYTYDHKKQAMAVPDPYEAVAVYHGTDKGFGSPVDILHKDGRIYVLSGGENGRIEVYDEQFVWQETITFTKDGEPFATAEPTSVWIDRDGTILVSDRGKKLVIRFSASGEVLAQYGNPYTGKEETTDYLPRQVLTDYLGRLYVLSDGEYRGILQLDPDGVFIGFYGAKKITVTASVLLDYLWRNLMTETQIANSARYLPTEYSHMAIDEEGFIYVTSGSSSSSGEYIVKLNSNAKNVLGGSSYGDYNLGNYMGTWYTTSLDAVTVDDDGFITVLDKTWNRLFQYSPEGELLYVWGGKSDQKGTFSGPVQLISIGDRLLVADSTACTVTEFVPTAFGSDVREGYRLFEAGLFAESIEPWNRVLARCGNYESAYLGIGKAKYLQGEYREAMDYFRLASSRPNYSSAFQRYRSESMRDAFPVIMTSAVVLAATAALLLALRKKKRRREKRPFDQRGKLCCLLYILRHPVEGFQEMRYNHKGSLAIANGLVGVWFGLSVVSFNFTGFLFNTHEPTDFSVFSTLATTVVFAAVLCLSNWLLATFFEGKGRLKEVWIYFSYALVPMLLSSLVNLGLSRILVQDESFFMRYIGIIGMAWTAFLVFIALRELHQYTFWQNVFSLLATTVGILVILFLLFLLFNLFVQLGDFLRSVIEEIIYRINVGF